MGFVKVEQGNDDCTLHIHGRGLHMKGDRKLKLYLFYGGEECVGIWQGIVDNVNPAINYRLYFTREDVVIPENFDKINGIILESELGHKYAAVWNEGPVDVSRMRVLRPGEAADRDVQMELAEERQGSTTGVNRAEEIPGESAGGDREEGMPGGNAGGGREEGMLRGNARGGREEEIPVGNVRADGRNEMFGSNAGEDREEDTPGAGRQEEMSGGIGETVRDREMPGGNAVADRREEVSGGNAVADGREEVSGGNAVADRREEVSGGIQGLGRQAETTGKTGRIDHPEGIVDVGARTKGPEEISDGMRRVRQTEEAADRSGRARQQQETPDRTEETIDRNRQAGQQRETPDRIEETVDRNRQAGRQQEMPDRIEETVDRNRQAGQQTEMPDSREEMLPQRNVSARGETITPREEMTGESSGKRPGASVDMDIPEETPKKTGMYKEKPGMPVRKGMAEQSIPTMPGHVCSDQKEQKPANHFRCSKIQRNDLAVLPRCEWKWANNSFLLHGYYNYHHLAFIDDGERFWLGVPGIYHPQEAKAASTFGFTEFIPQQDMRIDLTDDEKSNEEQFGYWCRPIKRPLKM